MFDYGSIRFQAELLCSPLVPVTKTRGRPLEEDRVECLVTFRFGGPGAWRFVARRRKTSAVSENRLQLSYCCSQSPSPGRHPSDRAPSSGSFRQEFSRAANKLEAQVKNFRPRSFDALRHSSYRNGLDPVSHGLGYELERRRLHD